MIRTIVGNTRNTKDPKNADATPSAVKTRVKPATNAIDARSVTVRASLVPSADVGSAEMYDTYPGSNGRQHGEEKESTPATTAKRGSRYGDTDYTP